MTARLAGRTGRVGTGSGIAEAVHGLARRAAGELLEHGAYDTLAVGWTTGSSAG